MWRKTTRSRSYGLGRVWVGFGQLYSPYNGYTDDSRAKAHLLKEAFRLSYCSFEVKSLADDASSSYDVE